MNLPPGSLVGLLLLCRARSAPAPQVRVLLARAAALRVVPVAGSRLGLRDGSGNLLERREDGLTLRATRGRIAGVAGEPQRLWLLPDQPNGSFWLQQRRYRGALLVQLKQGACRPSIAWVSRAISPAWWALRCPINGLQKP